VAEGARDLPIQRRDRGVARREAPVAVDGCAQRHRHDIVPDDHRTVDAMTDGVAKRAVMNPVRYEKLTA
jgi:hypothetical protein